MDVPRNVRISLGRSKLIWRTYPGASLNWGLFFSPRKEFRVLIRLFGLLIFDDDSLADVLHRLKQIYNIEYTITDPEIAASPLHATFQGEELSEILRLIRLSAPLNIDLTENSDSIYTRRFVTISPALPD